MTAPKRVRRLADVVNKLGRELMALEPLDRVSLLSALCALAKFWPARDQMPESLSNALRSAVHAGQPTGIEAVEAFWVEEKLVGDPAGFYQFWKSREWRDKVGLLRDWRARARVWSMKEADFSSSPHVEQARRKAYRDL